jgi:hypothetical protein
LPPHPGEIVTLFGEDLGPEEFVPLAPGGDGRLSTELAGTRIVFVAGSHPAGLCLAKPTGTCAVWM